MATPKEGSFLTDEELVDRYRNSHDTAYVGELYVRYTHLVYGVCIKYIQDTDEAQDAVMQIFEKLMTDLKKHHIETFKPWLYMVVKNYCMMRFRKESATLKKIEDYKNTAAASVENQPLEHQDTEEEKSLIMSYMTTGLDSLREDQKMCIELFYLRDMSYQQIAASTGFSLGEVKSNIQNGKRNLKNYIIEQQHGKA